MEDQLTYISVMLDSCAFYPPESIEKIAERKLWKLKNEGKIILQIADSTEKEMKNAPLHLHNRVEDLLVAGVDPLPTYNGILEAKVKSKEIANVLFPGKSVLTLSDKIDVRNIFVASGWSYDFFVTYDKKHILNKADIIKEKFQLQVVTPCQCLKQLEEMIGDSCLFNNSLTQTEN